MQYIDIFSQLKFIIILKNQYEYQTVISSLTHRAYIRLNFDITG